MSRIVTDYTEYNSMPLYALSDAELVALIVRVENEEWEEVRLRDIYLDRLRARVQARTEVDRG